MRRELIRKDIVLFLKDFKFQIFFLIMMILFILSGISSAMNLKKKQEDFLSKTEYARQNANNVAKSMMGLLSWFDILYYQEADASDLVIENSGFPIVLKTQINHYNPYPEQYSRSEKRNYDLNWLFIIGVIGTFMVLIFSFDAISEEKLHGMLKLQTIHGLSRSNILYSKFFSVILLYLICIIPASLVSLLIFTAMSNMVSYLLIWKFIIFIILSVPLIAFFTLIGLWISMSRNYLTNVVIALAFWLIFIVIIPQLSSIIGKKFVPLKSNTEMLKERGEANQKVYDIYWEKYGTKFGGNGNLQDGIRAKGFDELDKICVLTDEKNKQIFFRQINMIQRLSFISPYSIFKYMNEILFDKNAYRLKNDLEQFKEKQTEIRKQLIEEDKLDKSSLHLVYNGAENDKYVLLNRGLTPFSAKAFSSPEKLVISEYREETLISKMLKISLGLMVMLAIDLMVLVIITLKFKKFDIR